jgi:nitrous oxidase accessory protein NosD
MNCDKGRPRGGAGILISKTYDDGTVVEENNIRGVNGSGIELRRVTHRVFVHDNEVLGTAVGFLIRGTEGFAELTQNRFFERVFRRICG